MVSRPTTRSWPMRSRCRCKGVYSVLKVTYYNIGLLHRYEEIVAAHEIAYVAGGAAQNVARGAAVSKAFFFLHKITYLIDRFDIFD